MMKDLKKISLILMILFASVTVFEYSAYARAGGGRSSGRSGSRSYSAPKRTNSDSAVSRQTPAQPNTNRGSFLKSLGGGILGGMLGGALFNSLGLGGYGGGGGIGILWIILIAVAGYFIYKKFKTRPKEPLSDTENSYQQSAYQTQNADMSVDDGIDQIRQMDPSFNETNFTDHAMDIFFKIQGAWTNRDLSTVKNLISEEMKDIFQEDIDVLLKDKKTNKLDNIAVRKVEIVEAWQEAGQDFIKALFTANLIDYTTNDKTGAVVSGSKTEPVKFEEYWTFTRAAGKNPWKLSSIGQA